MSTTERPETETEAERPIDAAIDIDEVDASDEADAPPPSARSRLRAFLDSRREALLALVFMTRLPIPLPGRPAEGEATRIWVWFPLVGLVVGALSALVYALAWWCGASGTVAALFAVGAAVWATGAMHEDGLADTFDGLGGGRDRDTKLAIMRDSRIGTFGVIAIGLALAARVAALSDLETPWETTRSLIAAAVLSRSVLPMIAVFSDPARADGLARMCGRPSRAAAGVAALAGVVIAVAFLGEISAAAIVAAGLAGGLVAAIARRHIGGHTGDILGAAQQVGEVSILLLLSMAAG